MLAPSMIRQAINQLALRDPEHAHALMDYVCSHIHEEVHLQHFDSFAFTWAMLPEWARVMLLASAFRHYREVFAGIQPSTPIYSMTEQQREYLAVQCERLLSVIVTLFSDWQFTEEFYQGWSSALHQKNLIAMQEHWHSQDHTQENVA